MMTLISSLFSAFPQAPSRPLGLSFLVCSQARSLLPHPIPEDSSLSVQQGKGDPPQGQDAAREKPPIPPPGC